jgi:hypothetical protein
MAHQPTCGQGLADRSELPAKLAELESALADVLKVHTKTLDLEDESARLEHAAYERLIEEHRATAASLRATSEEMAGYRDLPMARHDATALSSPEATEAFERFVRVEQDLLALLQRRTEQDRSLLDEMRGAS